MKIMATTFRPKQRAVNFTSEEESLILINNKAEKLEPPKKYATINEIPAKERPPLILSLRKSITAFENGIKKETNIGEMENTKTFHHMISVCQEAIERLKGKIIH